MLNEKQMDLNVLYVEDEPILREEITRFLKRRVKTVTSVENGQEALAIFDVFKFDFVITDLMMPVLDGVEMAKKIREKNLDIPIVITTALSDVELMQSTIEVGIDRYLLKPIDVETLNQMLISMNEKLTRKKKKEQRFRLSLDEVKSIERKTETEIARVIKLSTGKGPNRVQAFLQANLCEIVISGSRTQLEQTILKQEKNTRIGDYLREVLYTQLKETFETSIKEVTGIRVVFQGLKCNSTKDIDVIRFIFEF
ncbi:Na-translocating system protein MpsC family protein [Fusibacter bizertensis]|uniref:Stage 0 sporulation protein A homolog n=1 Tax=Fusibacter bizertensis TaxID=1488331 RepID=A0ABT6NCX5_9FIRM|nr:Na-translocating system protein MpsC family protein [Fusibacter bizertensis]MDH8678275.1 Na-translocating system protein MpsC family protein [Fusibacter bizertensis]